MIPLGERHFRRAVAEFVEHYHRERHHQGLWNVLIVGGPPSGTAGRVRRRPRLGGLLNSMSGRPDLVARPRNGTERASRPLVRVRVIRERRRMHKWPHMEYRRHFASWGDRAVRQSGLLLRLGYLASTTVCLVLVGLLVLRPALRLVLLREN